MSAPENPTDALIAMPGYGEVYLSPKIATLWTFSGELAMYNHVFLEIPMTSPDEAEAGDDAEPECLIALRIFHFEPGYTELVEIIEKHEFPQFLHLLDVDDEDTAVYFQKQFAVIQSALGES